DDVIDGGAGADDISGGLGDDTVMAGTGNDAIDGGDGDDTIYGQDGADTIDAGAGNDVIDGGGGNDILDGGAGDDTFKVSDGEDTVIAGPGDDILEIGAEYSIDTVDLSEDTGDLKFYLSKDDGSGSSTSHSVTIKAYANPDDPDHITPIKTLRVFRSETVYDDIKLDVTYDPETNTYTAATNDPTLMIGTSAGQTLVGGDGSDQIIGVGGDDLLEGGIGDDQLVGGTGADTLDGGVGNDQLSGGDDDDSLVGGAGDDDLSGGAGTDSLTGGAGDDVLDGGAGDDSLSGGVGDDRIYGGDGTDTVSFSDVTVADGEDASERGVEVDLVAGTASGAESGDDQISGIEHVIGGEGDDFLKGDEQENILTGGAGDDIFEGRGGDDSLVGGEGIDTASFSESTSSLTIDMTAGTATGDDIGSDTFDSIERVVAGSGDDVLMGSAADDEFDGGAGDDTYYASDGDDILITGGGSDTLHITAGYSISGLDLDGASGELTFSLIKDSDGSQHSVTIQEHDVNALSSVRVYNDSEDTANYDTYGLSVGLIPALNLFRATSGTATAIGGSEGDDAQMGGAGDDLIFGNAGADNIDGGLGDDTLMGGAGDDRYLVSAGDDRIYVGGGDDTLRLSGTLTKASFVDADSDDLMNDLRFTGEFGGQAYSATIVDHDADGGTGDNALTYVELDLEGDGSKERYTIGESLIVGTDNADELTGITKVAISGKDANLTEGDEFSITIGSATVSYTVLADDDISAARDALIEAINADETASGLVEAVAAAGGGDIVLRAISEDTGFSVLAESSNSKNAMSVDGGVLIGNEGDDVIAGGAGVDQLAGGVGDDVLDGGSGDDILDGGIGDDLFKVSDGQDTVLTGGGADVLEIGGSFAIETLLLDRDTGDLTVGLSKDGEAGFHSVTVMDYSSIGGGDTFSVIEGGDTLSLGVNYDANTNTYTAASDADTQVAGTDDDDNLTGGGGDDRLFGNRGDDVFDGGTGDDVFIGGAGDDTATFEALDVNLAVDLADGTAVSSASGADTLSSIENVLAGAGDDVLGGSAGDNLLDGGAGDDTLAGGAGDDILIGGEGTDTASYQGATTSVTVDLAEGIASSADMGADTLSGIENIIGGEADDVITGDSGNNEILGGAGDDTLSGGGGTDILSGGAGNDLYEVGSGDVQINVGGGEDKLLLLGTLTSVSLAGDDLEFKAKFLSDYTVTIMDQKGDPLTEVELDLDGDGTTENFVIAISEGGYTDASSNVRDTLIVGSSGDDEVIGGEASDIVLGDAGDDILSGGGGVDQLTGGAGDDTLAGGAGDDVLAGGEGLDTITFTDVASDLTVDLAAGTAESAESGSDSVKDVEAVIAGAGDDTLTGNDEANFLTGAAGQDTIDGAGGDDVIDGGVGDDILAGGDGIDTIDGGDGDDTISGGAGNDILDGGEGVDTLSFAESDAGVLVDLSSNTATGADIGDDTISNFQNVIGGSGDDLLIGDEGDNRLSGGAGDNVYRVSDGNDVIVAGGGTDTLEVSADYGIEKVVLSSGGDLTFYLNKHGDDSDHTVTVEGHGETPVTDLRVYTGDQALTIGGAGAGEIYAFTVDGVDLTYTGLSGESAEDVAEKIAGLINDDADGAPSVSASLADNGTTLVITPAVPGQTPNIVIGEGASLTSSAIYKDYSLEVEHDPITNTYTAANVNLATRMDGTSSGEILVGGNRDDLIFGNEGDDTLAGGQGSDILDGGLGDDEYQVSAGDDLIYVGGGDDTLTLSGALNSVRLVDGDLRFEATDAESAYTATVVDHDIDPLHSVKVDFDGDGLSQVYRVVTDDETLAGSEDETETMIVGSEESDNFVGGSLSDIVLGNEGDDVLDGGAGDDVLFGGAGDDTFKVSDGHDVIVSGVDDDTLEISADYTLDTVRLDDQTGDLTFSLTRYDDAQVAAAEEVFEAAEAEAQNQYDEALADGGDADSAINGYDSAIDFASAVHDAAIEAAASAVRSARAAPTRGATAGGRGSAAPADPGPRPRSRRSTARGCGAAAPARPSPRSAARRSPRPRPERRTGPAGGGRGRGRGQKGGDGGAAAGQH
ncbi:MAG: hypothetical protein CFH10_01325, partial [Alphaproteobacteria bacterium MarineAlpha4_Bin2]